MKNRYDYTGKTIFTGIDVHKKTYSVVTVCDGEIIKRDTMPAYPDRLVAYLLKFFPGAKIKSAYEAGFSGFYLHRILLKKGIENMVVHAASIEISSRDRVKTDKRDAAKIAVQLSTNRLKGIFVPPPEMEDKRELTRYRTNLVKDRNRIAARLKHKAHQYGLVGPDDIQTVCSQWFKQFEKKKMNPNLRYVFDALIEEWNHNKRKIKEVDNLLKIQATEDKDCETVYRSVKGVGPAASRVLANELGNMQQFSSERALFSYTGLTPSEHSSGEHQRKGHISRQGKSILRCMLVQCSWVAIRYDKNLRDQYDRIAARAGGKRAIVAIARRLIGRIRSCFRQGVLYNNQPLEDAKRHVA